MLIDILVAEIGSTTTLINAFNGINTPSPRFIGQGQAPTSVLEGDVRVGLNAAIKDLAKNLNAASVEYGKMFATSSAAGGLRMCVHGLVYDMTVKAAQAAALGAGAIIKLATAGKMSEYDMDDVKAINPNLILLAGGTDYGERETAVYNARLIADSGLKIPIIYGGNIQNQRIIEDIFKSAGIPFYITENVYPKLDLLNIEPARRIIHAVFEEHIVKAAGMEHIRELVTGNIVPTPGAVMEAAQLLYSDIGDLAVIDIGGATTDVHSVTAGSEEIAVLMTTPEPFAKRTVEGDLGLFVNAKNLIEMLGKDKLQSELSIDMDEVIANYKPIPETDEQFKLTERLCLAAGLTAVERHSGALRYIYTPKGRQTIAEGKDLTKLKYLVGTGGALTRLPHREKIMRQIADMNTASMMLYPKPERLKLLYDNDYIMASLGVLSKVYPEAALSLMRQSLGIEQKTI
ncbi:MAG: glutamate mutase L [Christensenellaceae bacterium]|nr:glutamate mutase L [Christensenellaceae bacterium]